MNNDIRRQNPNGRQPAEYPQPAQTPRDEYVLPSPVEASPEQQQYVSDNTETEPPMQQPPHTQEADKNASTSQKKRRWWLWLLCAIIGIAIVVAGWVAYQFTPVNASSGQNVFVEVAEGAAPSAIAANLEEQQVIRNATVFTVYLRLTGAGSDLQAGKFQLSQKDSMTTTINKLSQAQTQEVTLTFIPGQTLREYKDVLIKAGYDEQAVVEAFTKRYPGTIASIRPTNTDLEGFIYPETYRFAVGASPEDVLTRTFLELERVIDVEDLQTQYQRVGLSLYEGITLASIIQREAASDAEMAQISQVFHLRLDRNMPLGSDPTYQYIADKLGIERRIDLDSPYNTREETGLTPTPIASPSKAALLAAANPADGDFVYFVHGDDGQIRYARTNAEHEANVRQYCIELCKRV